MAYLGLVLEPERKSDTISKGARLETGEARTLLVMMYISEVLSEFSSSGSEPGYVDWAPSFCEDTVREIAMVIAAWYLLTQ